MNADYYLGCYTEDATGSPNRGWLVGTFMEAGPRKTEQVEVKYWEFKTGQDPKQGRLKTSSTIECTFVLKGETKCLINGDEVRLKAGDYIVIPPGLANNTVAEIIADAAGITVKAPSDPQAKQWVS